MSTFAVLARCSFDEGPYLPEFVQHYLALGFDHIYLINTYSTRDYLHENLPGQTGKSVTVVDFDTARPGWQIASVNHGAAAVKEEWILHVDADEFLYLGGRSVIGFLDGVDPDVSVVHFPWVIALGDRYSYGSVFDIPPGNYRRSVTVKTMAKAGIVERWRLHDVERKGKPKTHRARCATGAYLLHFACRGFFDLFCRILARDYQNEKTGEGEIRKLLNIIQERPTQVRDSPSGSTTIASSGFRARSTPTSTRGSSPQGRGSTRGSSRGTSRASFPATGLTCPGIGWGLLTFNLSSRGSASGRGY